MHDRAAVRTIESAGCGFAERGLLPHRCVPRAAFLAFESFGELHQTFPACNDTHARGLFGFDLAQWSGFREADRAREMPHLSGPSLDLEAAVSSSAQGGRHDRQ